MRRIITIVSLALLGGWISAGIIDQVTAQEKPKSAISAKPIEVQFSASDALKIAKYRSIAQEANNSILAILKTYSGGDDGEFILDADGQWIGIRRTPKAEPKKP